MFKVPEKYRVTHDHPLSSTEAEGNNGIFHIPHPKVNNYLFLIQASDGAGWEHVSVSVTERGKRQHRCPTWGEMCFVKDLFWHEDVCVIQYHPAKVEYVNMHPFVLHLWRPIGVVLPTPDKIMVGINL